MTASDGSGVGQPDAEAPAEGYLPCRGLWPLERKMRRKAEAGELLSLPNSAEELRAMDASVQAQRTIRAAVLRQLLVEGGQLGLRLVRVHAKGVRLRGVRISGPLDLEAATLRCPLRLEQCYFDASEPVNLDYATGSVLALTRCLLAGLRGESCTIKKQT